MARCLVTGGLGFIGSHLVQRLVAEGHSVVVLDDCSAPAGMMPTPCPVYRSLDLLMSEDGGTIDVVFNMAAVSRTPDAIRDPGRCNATNVGLTLEVLGYFRTDPCPPRVVHSSSNVVYGVPNPYKASKLAAEHYIEAYNAVYGANAIALRYSNVIGPGMRRGDPAVFASLRDCRERHGYVEVTGDGLQTRNFTYVSDIVEANLLAWRSDHKGVIDVSTGVVTTMNEFAQFFDCPVRYIPDRHGDTKHIHQPLQGGSVPSAHDVLGWTPQVPFAEAMRLSFGGAAHA